MEALRKNNRRLSVLAFGFSFAYLMAFLFEGQVLYQVLERHNQSTDGYVFFAILAHFFGLFTGGFFIKSLAQAKKVMLLGLFATSILTLPFYFAPSGIWLVALSLAGYCAGVSVSAWGSFFKAFTPKDQRLKSSADVLILSNGLMILINVASRLLSVYVGLSLSLGMLLLGMMVTWLLPVEEKDTSPSKGTEKKVEVENLMRTLLLLCVFIVLVTINSGLMYQVINPAFGHHELLVSFYWAIPYIGALLFMRNLPPRFQRTRFLYGGMVMIMASFIFFMVLGRGVTDYLVINTFMLAACGIFDLFWWSILGEMLTYTKEPSKVFGMGLSANVFGVFLGGMLGVTITGLAISLAEVAVIALTVVCFTLILLPPVNRELSMLLKNHVYLSVYDNLSTVEKSHVIERTKTIEELTAREKEVLEEVLSGKSNKDIATTLFISESTVKTHVRNIFSKYDVSSRAELISTLLKNESAQK